MSLWGLIRCFLHLACAMIVRRSKIMDVAQFLHFQFDGYLHKNPSPHGRSLLVINKNRLICYLQPVPQACQVRWKSLWDGEANPQRRITSLVKTVNKSASPKVQPVTPRTSWRPLESRGLVAWNAYWRCWGPSQRSIPGEARMDPWG